MCGLVSRACAREWCWPCSGQGTASPLGRTPFGTARQRTYQEAARPARENFLRDGAKRRARDRPVDEKARAAERRALPSLLTTNLEEAAAWPWFRILFARQRFLPVPGRRWPGTSGESLTAGKGHGKVVAPTVFRVAAWSAPVAAGAGTPLPSCVAALSPKVSACEDSPSSSGRGSGTCPAALRGTCAGYPCVSKDQSLWNLCCEVPVRRMLFLTVLRRLT